jgi:hypothetical protein
MKRALIQKVEPDTVIKLYKTLALQILLYGSEAWKLISAKTKRIVGAEMKLLPPLAGHTLSCHLRNKDIRQKLEIENVTNKFSTYRNNWLDHLERMTPDRIP